MGKETIPITKDLVIDGIFEHTFKKAKHYYTYRVSEDSLQNSYSLSKTNFLCVSPESIVFPHKQLMTFFIINIIQLHSHTLTPNMHINNNVKNKYFTSYYKKRKKKKLIFNF